MTAALRWLLSTLAILAITIQPAHAAHIQSVPCLSTHFQPRIQHDLADQTGLRLRLEPLNATHDRLFLSASPPFRLPGHDDLGCDSWYAEFGIGTVALELSTLGRDDAVSYFAVAQNCVDNEWKGAPKQLEIQSDYPTIPQLSTFQIALYFLLDGNNKNNNKNNNRNNDTHDVRESPNRVGAVENAEQQRVGACRRSAATVRPTSWLIMTLRYVPMSILALVVVAGVVRSLPSTAATLMASAANSASTPGGRNNNKTPPRPILPNVGDCLQYLQFIFLTACLSLRYPGFYQPAVSELRWYSLFGTSLWKGYYGGGQTYDGFVDGIYELNGTFGGTYGAELMTQVVGAPLTMGTWFNMVICVAIAAVAVAVLLWGLWVLEARKTVRLGLPALGGTGPGDSSSVFPKPGPLANNVAKVILSYFMLPVVALSAYQLDYADQLPITHSTFAVAMLAMLFAAFVWLVWRMPTRSLGVLLFDSSKRYRRLGGGDGPGGGVLDDDDNDDDNDDDHDNHHNHNNNTNSNSAAASRSRSRGRSDKLFVYALFLTTFIRAALIGGVQVSGLAQVISLFCTEFIFASYIVAIQAYPLMSIGSFAAGVRVLSIAAMIAFVPDMVSETPREVLGYAVLAMHALFLFCGFGLGSVWHLGNAVAQRVKAGKDVEAYGLRALNRRPDSRNDLAFRSDLDVHSPSAASPQSPSYYRRSQLPDRAPGRDVHSPHPGTRLDIPSLYSGDSGRNSPASLSPYLHSPVSPVGVRTPFPGPRHHPPTSVPRSATPNTLNDSRLGSLRSSELRSSSSGASRSSASSGSARGSGHGHGSGSGSADGGYYFRPPRSSTYAPSLTESTTTSRARGAGGGGGSRLQSAIFTREPVLSPGEASRPQSVVTVRSPGEHDGERDGARGAKRAKKTIRMVLADDEEGVEDGRKKQATRAKKAQDDKAEPLGPRWNDYSFREADLIYGGPDEGEFEAARAHYGAPTHATNNEAMATGRASTTTMGTMSTLQYGSKMSQDTTRIDDADNEDDGGDRPSDFATKVKKKDKRAAATAAAAARGLAKGKLYQLRQLSSQSRLSLPTASSSSAGKGVEGEPSSAGDSEQGFSVRRPRPPEHILRQMAAAARAQQIQEQDTQNNDMRGSASLDSVRERRDEEEHDAAASAAATRVSKDTSDDGQ